MSLCRRVVVSLYRCAFAPWRSGPLALLPLSFSFCHFVISVILQSVIFLLVRDVTQWFLHVAACFALCLCFVLRASCFVLRACALCFVLPWVSGFGLRAWGVGFRVSGSGFRVLGFGLPASFSCDRVSGCGSADALRGRVTLDLGCFASNQRQSNQARQAMCTVLCAPPSGPGAVWKTRRWEWLRVTSPAPPGCAHRWETSQSCDGCGLR